MAELMTLLGFMVGAGYLMRRSGLVRAEMADDLTKVVFYFTVPPLIFTALHRAELDVSMLLLPLAAWGLMLMGLGSGLLITRALGMPGPRAGAVIIVTVFGNTTFLGYPIVRGFYGEEGLTLAIFYDLLGATLAANTVALVLASMLGGKEKVRGLQIIRRVALFPPIWGLFFGLLLRPVALPLPLEEVLRTIGELTAPLIMIAIGLSLRFSAWRESLPLVLTATAGKLVLLPAVAWLVLSSMAFPPEMLRVAVLQAGMPTMFFSLTLALLFGLKKTIVVNTIMLSTLLSFGTLPALRWLLGP